MGDEEIDSMTALADTGWKQHTYMRAIEVMVTEADTTGAWRESWVEMCVGGRHQKSLLYRIRRIKRTRQTMMPMVTSFCCLALQRQKRNVMSGERSTRYKGQYSTVPHSLILILREMYRYVPTDHFRESLRGAVNALVRLSKLSVGKASIRQSWKEARKAKDQQDGAST